MPNPAPARYRAADGALHEVIAEPTPAGRWRVVDVSGDERVLVEELTGYDDRQPQAESLARDYAAQQQARHGGQRPRRPLGASANRRQEHR